MSQITRPASILVILRRAYLNITGNHCAAKLIEYFRHWREWKVKNHRTDWVYMPLRQIHEDLMGEHSLHVIRAAIALLEKLGFVKRRQNPGNGQDKTYQYQLNVDAIAAKLPSDSSECKVESPECRNELSKNNVEQHTQITTTNIQNTNITPTEQVGEKNSFSQEAEGLIDKYEEKLKTFTIYKNVWGGDKLIPNPKMKPVLQVLAKVPLDRAERSILAFLGWFKKQDANKIKCKYKSLASAIAGDWELAQ